jgi:lauroyl/myristoyl acyltransferase
MDLPLYWLARVVVGLLRRLPLLLVARLGRAGGELAYWCDARHRRVARRNLARCFGGEKSAAELRRMARENFRRIGESFACAVKTAFMTPEALKPHVEFIGTDVLLPRSPQEIPQSRVVAIGHFGNFELYTRFHQYAPVFRAITTYRGLRQPSLNRLMQSLRTRSGCEFFERRTEANALKAAMTGGGVLLGLLADQHAGNRGLRLPFLGQDCSTSAAPAVFALRYDCRLHTAICYRTGLARWRIELGPEIPLREQGEARPVEAIALEMNRAFEAGVRRDPANWFWVHDRWKPASVKSPTAVSKVEPDESPQA